MDRFCNLSLSVLMVRGSGFSREPAWEGADCMTSLRDAPLPVPLPQGEGIIRYGGPRLQPLSLWERGWGEGRYG